MNCFKDKKKHKNNTTNTCVCSTNSTIPEYLAMSAADAPEPSTNYVPKCVFAELQFACERHRFQGHRTVSFGEQNCVTSSLGKIKASLPAAFQATSTPH